MFKTIVFTLIHAINAEESFRNSFNKNLSRNLKTAHWTVMAGIQPCYDACSYHETHAMVTTLKIDFHNHNS